MTDDQFVGIRIMAVPENTGWSEDLQDVISGLGNIYPIRKADWQGIEVSLVPTRVPTREEIYQAIELLDDFENMPREIQARIRSLMRLGSGVGANG